MKFHYGIAAASIRQLSELPVMDKVDFIELPSIIREQPDFSLPPAWARRLMRVSCRAETRTLGALIGAGGAMIKEFFRVFSNRCDDFFRLGAKEISLGIDWENVFAEAEFAEKLAGILRCCYGIAVKYHLTLVAEVRVPGAAAGRAMDFLRFRDRLLIPVRTLIDLHPHEPGALELFESFAGQLPFECSRIRISFDADGGNYLTDRLLERIISSIHRVGCEIPDICFYPGRNADKSAFAALETVIR